MQSPTSNTHLYMCGMTTTCVSYSQVGGAKAGREGPGGTSAEPVNSQSLPDSGQHKSPDVHSQTTTMLAMLDARVAGVEATMAAALGRISDILSEMCKQKDVIGRQAAQQTSENIVETPAAVGASTPSERVTRATAKEVCTISHPVKPSVQQANVAVEGAPDPDPVLLSDEISNSAGNGGGCGRGRPVGEPPATQVTQIPLSRTIPTDFKPANSVHSVSTEDTSQSESVDAAQRPRRYKDPPGNEKAADFGGTSPTSLSVPTLMPRRSNVSF